MTAPQTTCLYCGKPYAIGPDQCPHCQAPAHQRPQSKLRQFRWFFILLALFCLAMILWLPR
ncbi:MAG: protein DnrP [Gammaproteobacteria bacterium]|nr:protein DnrP [Gammaproteobacteria bacterium]